MGSSGSTARGPTSRIEGLVSEAISRTKQQKDSTGQTAESFHRIILQIPKLRDTFNSVRAVFGHFDASKTGYMSVTELQEALSRLTAQDVSPEETEEFFLEADVYDNGQISFKEFVVLLAIGYVLNTMPALSASGSGKEASSKSTPDEKPRHPRLVKLTREERRPSFLNGEGPKLRDAFALIMDAYLAFDTDGKGFITRENMQETIISMGSQSPVKSGKGLRRTAGAGPATALLTEERMDEMDWDKNGRISYKEFVFSFLAWVGMEEEEEEEPSSSGDGGPSAAGGSKYSGSRK